MTRPSDVDPLADEPLRYVLACQPLHDRLREVATRLGGLSLMVMLGREAGVDLETPLSAAAAMVEETRDALGVLPVPEAATHHFHHMGEAAEALRRVSGLLAAGSLARGAGPVRTGISVELRAATDHLRFAARALPGFAMVDLTQSCCAAHAAAPSRPEAATELLF